MTHVYKIIPVIAILSFTTLFGQQDLLFRADFEPGIYYPFADPTITRGTAEIVDSAVFCGKFSFRSYVENETVSGSRNAFVTGVFAHKDTCVAVAWSKFYFKLGSNFTHTQDNNHALITSFAKTGVGAIPKVTIYRHSNNLYLGLFGTTTETRGGGITPLSLNTWYCCEFEYDTVQGRMAVYLNGNKELEFTGLSGMQAVNEIRIGWSTWMLNQSGDIFFDNVQVSAERIPYSAQEMHIVAPPSFFGRIGMRFIVSLTKINDGDKFIVTLTGEKGYNEQVFYRESELEKYFDFTMNLRNLVADNYTLKIELKDAGDNVILEEMKSFNKPYDGVPVTGINENSAVCYNGDPIFFIHTLGLRRGSIAHWIDHKFCNLMEGYFDQPQCPPSWADYLDQSQAAGTYAIGPLKDTTWVNRSAGGVPYPTLDEIESAVNANKDHPALFFWTWMDEPVSNNMNITGSTDGNIALVKSWTEKTHEADPQHLVFTSEWATLASYPTLQSKLFYPNWTADVYSFDHYAVEFEADNGLHMAEIAELNERYNKYNFGLIPFSAWTETCDVRSLGHAHDVSLYPPTQEQLRMLCWIPIVHGAKGLSWFPYFGATPPENYVEMSEIVRFTEEYKDIILDAEPEGISITDDANELGRRVDAMIRETETDYYVFAIRVSEVAGEVFENPAEQDDITVKFTVNGVAIDDGAIEDVFSVFSSAMHQEWDVAASGQTFNLNLDTPIEPGSLILGGGYLSSNSDVDYPTQWVYLYDNGDGLLVPEFSWQHHSGTIDYETGSITCDFQQDIDAGTKKIHAGFLPKETSIRGLAISNNEFSDTFERCELHVYRISKGSNPDTISAVNGIEAKPGTMRCYPNPFSISTNIDVKINTSGYYSLKILDITGREITVVTESFLPAGKHTFVWNGKNSAGEVAGNGVYIYRLQHGNSVLETNKIIKF